jgi:S-adenosylmethionine-diacylglycerol 3-amino-3-carboxypropyl transferase
MTQSIEARARFDFIRYASCWEDADILAAALRPAPGRRLLSIASAGDNSLALLAGGAEVVAADLNLVQLACVEIRKVAFAHLDYPDLLAFLGVTPDPDRLQTFGRLATALSPAGRAFWEARPEAIRTGIIHAGKFENYFQMFRTRILPLIHSRKTVETLLEERDDHARRRFYDDVWDNWRWRLLFRLFFSRTVMGRMGRDPEFFRYVEGSVAGRIRTRAEHALAVLPAHSNPYLEYILTGNFRRALPAYLRPEAYAPIRANLDRLTLYHGPIQEAAKACGGGFDGFNLSDIFEYLPPELCRTIYGNLLETARPGARLAYWNMLVPRRFSATPEFSGRVRHLNDLSRSLFLQDKAFFYSAFIVEET